MNTQQLFEFARNEVLVLESPDVADDQWEDSLPIGTKLDDDLTWDRWFNACQRLDTLGVIIPDRHYPLSWCLKQVSKRAIKKALKDW